MNGVLSDKNKKGIIIMTLKKKFEEKKQKMKEFYEEHKLEVGMIIGGTMSVIVGIFARDLLQREETVEGLYCIPNACWRIGHDEDQNCNYMEVKRGGDYIKTSHGRKMKFNKDIVLGFQIDKKCRDELQDELFKLSFDD